MTTSTTLLEWSPNESCLTKLERLAFALIRKQSFPEVSPLPEVSAGDQTFESFRFPHPWTAKLRALAGSFALQILIGLPLLGIYLTGTNLVVALLLAGIDAMLAVWCYTDLESQHGHCPGDLIKCLFQSVGEFPAFFIGWWRIQGLSAGFGVTCRTLSELLDGVTGRHVSRMVSDHFGLWKPLGAELDILAPLIAFVPTLLCIFGMEESGFLRTCLFLLTTGTAFGYLGFSIESNVNSSVNIPHPPTPEAFQCLLEIGRSWGGEILLGAAVASIGFFGLYRVSCPEPPSVHYNCQSQKFRHYTLRKRLSLIGCLIMVTSFIVYFIEGTVFSRISHKSNRLCRDPPLLWWLEGNWKLGIAVLGISALSLATLQFIIPLCSTVTKMANIGLLYRLLRKDVDDIEEGQWTLLTPLAFGFLSALQALVLSPTVLVGLIGSSLLSTHVVIAAAMLTSRYQVRINPSPHQRISSSLYRRPSRTLSTSQPQVTPDCSDTGNSVVQARRLLTVSFLKSGITRIPSEVKKLEVDTPRITEQVSTDRTCLIDDIGIAPLNQRESIHLSMGSGVSGYESNESDEDLSAPETRDLLDLGDTTDIDAVVAEYRETVRLAALNGGPPPSPTPVTGRHVGYATLFLVLGCLTLGAALHPARQLDLIGLSLSVSTGFLSFLLLVLISRQPQRREVTVIGPGSIRRRDSGFIYFVQSGLVPWGPGGIILCHSLLLVETVDLAGFAFPIWLATGLIVYFSYGVTKSVAAGGAGNRQDLLVVRSESRRGSILVGGRDCGLIESNHSFHPSSNTGGQPSSSISTSGHRALVGRAQSESCDDDFDSVGCRRLIIHT